MTRPANRLADLIRDCGLSQAALSRKSGVSRVQISRIVNGNVETIQPRTLTKLASALGVKPRELGEVAPIGQYRRIVEQRLGKKTFAGLGLPDLPAQDLDAIFVPPLAVRHQAQPEECGKNGMAARVARDSYDDAESNLIDAQRLIASTPRLVTLGCPGAGKSTVLQHVAVQTARGEFFGENCLPVFVRLPEFAAALAISPDTDFVSWIVSRAEQAGCRGFGEEFVAWLSGRDNTVLFLFDGLDEVPSETDRRNLVEAILDFVQHHSGSRFCITSRPIGFEETPWRHVGFEVIRLVEYGDEQIDKAISNWSKVFARGKVESPETVGENLSRAIRENPRVRRIASNPLILTVLVFLCQSRGYALPRRRVDLYCKVADVFLESWESSKRPRNAFSETLDIDLDTRELSWLISDVALEMQRRGLVLAKRWWLEERIEETLRVRIGLDGDLAKDATGRILRFISSRTGLLEERALDLFAFSHRTLQEYFAAVGAINEADSGSDHALPKLVRPHLFKPEWSEVVRLIASQVTPPRAEELIRIILDDPDPSGRFLHRGPLLAVRCLLDGATVANRRVVEQVFRSFDDLGRSAWLGITLEAISELKRFTQTRFEPLAKSAIGRILDGAQRSLNSEEYKTLVLRAKSPEVTMSGLCGEEHERSAVVEIVVSADGVRRELYAPNFDLLAENQDEWHRHAVKIIEDSQLDFAAKEVVIWQMGLQSKFHPRSRVRLKHILRKGNDAKLRTAAALALRSCVSGRRNAGNLLRRLLKSDDNSSVRAACAYALAGAAGDDPRTRGALRDSLEHDSAEEVQVAAAHALKRAVTQDNSIAGMLLGLAREASQEEVQVASVYALEPLLKNRSDIQASFRQWAYGNDARTRPACQVLAEAFAEGDGLGWDDELVSRVEDVLRSIGQPECNLGLPCPHALLALEALVDARESQSGLRVESVLARCLEPFSDRLQWAFIFGSIARNEQSDASDVDLMLIGDVRMREVSSGIKQAESTLGRAVNPVIYSYDTFVEKLHAGDPFVTEVIREPKIPLQVGGRWTTVKELDDELRAVEAERLAHSR